MCWTTGQAVALFLFIIVMSDNSQNQIFQYNGSPITFQKGDSVMINATEMAKPFGKRTNDFLSSKSTNELICSLSVKTGISATELVIVNQGGRNQGTWLHEDLALIFAQWLSPDFYLWCNDRIKELLTHGITATQPTLEQIINNPDLIISLATQLKNEREEKARLLSENSRLLPKASFVDKIIDTGGKIDVGQAAKLLKLPFGRNKLFEELRKTGIFFKNRNEPKQQYIESGYFELREQFIERKDHPGFTVIKVLVTQKGLEFLNRLLNGEKSDGKMMKLA
jgi:phage antirepressor YoqD-like protein